MQQFEEIVQILEESPRVNTSVELRQIVTHKEHLSKAASIKTLLLCQDRVTSFEEELSTVEDPISINFSDDRAYEQNENNAALLCKELETIASVVKYHTDARGISVLKGRFAEETRAAELGAPLEYQTTPFALTIDNRHD